MKTKITLILLLIAATAYTPAFSNDTTLKTPVPANEGRVQELTNRLEEIAEKDFSNMPRVEKRELKKEVKSIKREMKTMGNGVYISVGSLIIIILLLIIIL